MLRLLPPSLPLHAPTASSVRAISSTPALFKKFYGSPAAAQKKAVPKNASSRSGRSFPLGSSERSVPPPTKDRNQKYYSKNRRDIIETTVSLRSAEYFANELTAAKRLNSQLLTHLEHDSWSGVTNVIINQNHRFNAVNWATAINVLKRMDKSGLRDDKIRKAVAQILHLLHAHCRGTGRTAHGLGFKNLGPANAIAVLRGIASENVLNKRTYENVVNIWKVASRNGNWLVKKSTHLQNVQVLQALAAVSVFDSSGASQASSDGLDGESGSAEQRNPFNPKLLAKAYTDHKQFGQTINHFLKERDLDSLNMLADSLTDIDMIEAVPELTRAVEDVENYRACAVAAAELGAARNIDAMLDLYIHGRELFDFELYSEYVFQMSRSTKEVAEFEIDQRLSLLREELALQVLIIYDRRDPPIGGTPRKMMKFLLGVEALGVDGTKVAYWVNSRAGWWVNEAGERDQARIVEYAKEKGLVCARLEDAVNGKGKLKEEKAKKEKTATAFGDDVVVEKERGITQ
jgi:hypothetical protein